MATAREISEGEQAALARLQELAGERDADAREALRHLRNVLSVVRSLAQRTGDETESVEEFRAVFDGRLAALARVQTAVGRDTRAGKDLGAIIGDELLAFGVGVGEGVELSGRPVRLAPRAAGLVALAVHELAGDFATRGECGPVRVSWTAEDGLDIDWVTPTDGDGCSARALPDWVGRAIAYELRGEVIEDGANGERRRRIRLPGNCYVATG